HSKGLWLARIAMAIMAVAVAASLSRGAWLGVLAGALIVLALMRGQKSILIGAICLIGALAVAGTVSGAAEPSPVVQRISSLVNPQTSQLDATVRERLFTYQAALEQWPQHPWIGWGTGA